MSGTKAPLGVKLKPVAYEDFQGLDVSRALTSLDTGKQQHLSTLKNGFCDWRGQITKDPGGDHLSGDLPIQTVGFYSSDSVVWAEQDGAGINLVSESGHQKIGAFTSDSVVDMVVFNRRVHFFSEDQLPVRYDGTKYEESGSPSLDKLKPAFGVSVGRRLAVAGIRGRETEIHLSRVDDATIFPEDEPPDSVSVTRASSFSVENQLGTSEVITGLARFEQQRLAVFTNDRVLVYFIDPDLTQWTLDDKAAINIGCVSHRSIVSAGADLLFCSRAGVHSLRRSLDNGITIEGESLSNKIDILYRELIAQVPNVNMISAVYDQDMGQYSIFFPQEGNALSTRLMMTLKPGVMEPKWSTGDFLQARCGAFLGGRLVYGTAGGVYTIGKIEDEKEVHPSMTLTFPVLWHGSFTDSKNIHSIILQASGTGNGVLEVINDENVTLRSDTFEIDEGKDDNFFSDVPLSAQYERKMELRYRGAQYRLTVSGKGLVRIHGFGVMLRKN